MKPLLAGLLCLMAGLARGEAQTLPMREPRLTEEQGREQLESFAATWQTRAQWEARAANIRSGILRGANLVPLPERNALNPIRWGRQQRRGYTVENVAFESLPGFFVTGNLYLPARAGERFPAMLCAHGHWAGTPRVSEMMQSRCAALARMGVVAFAYDMVGYTDSTQMEHENRLTLTLQLWDSMRCLDFVTSLPEVDSTRLGCTGESGGGTQTFLLGAVDDRLTLSVPVVQVSAHFFGGCICESGLPIHHSATHDTDNAEIAALFAPKPQCIISDGRDWTRNVPKVEFPYIHRVYTVCGAPDEVENVHFAEEGHDYGPTKRRAMYRFVAKHWHLRAGDADETDSVADPASLRVFGPGHPRPDRALLGAEAIAAALGQAKDQAAVEHSLAVPAARDSQ